MAKFIIEGGHKLKGTVEISGSKNAALPCLAATLLTNKPCILENVPEINDVRVMLELIKTIGGRVEKLNGNCYKIHTPTIKSTTLPSNLATKLRASILFMGPLLARAGKIKMVHPGGCIIGKRPIGTHFEALSQLGATFGQDSHYYWGKVDQLKGEKIFVDEVSVTASENTIMAASLAEGKTEITPAACEPHVVNLCQMLKKMGAKIKGEGSHTIKIEGVKHLKGCRHRIIADEIETGVFAIAAVITGGKITIKKAPLDNLDSILHKLSQMDVQWQIKNKNITIYPGKKLKASRIQIDTWPRLPTDIQPPFTILATQAKGESLIHDWLFERRLLYLDQLIKMGARIDLYDPHRALVHGPTKLQGGEIRSPDIRAGIAFVLAGLAARGKTTVYGAEMIERGYEKIEEKFKKLGAKIKRV